MGLERKKRSVGPGATENPAKDSESPDNAPAEPMYLAHAPGDSEFVAGFADALKRRGIPIGGRSLWSRKYPPREEDAERFREIWRQYLAQIDAAEPLETEYRVFLSYAREDYPYVSQFAQGLRNWGVDTWLDVEDVSDDEKWVDETLEALARCSSMVAFWSYHYTQSEAACSELDFFVEKVSKRHGIFLAFAPITMADASDVPLPLREAFCEVELYRLASDEAALELVIEMRRFYKAHEELLRQRKDELLARYLVEEGDEE